MTLASGALCLFLACVLQGPLDQLAAGHTDALLTAAQALVDATRT